MIKDRVIKLDEKTAQEINELFINGKFNYIKQGHYYNTNNAALILSENNVPFSKEFKNKDYKDNYELLSYNDPSVYEGIRYLNMPEDTVFTDHQNQVILNILIKNDYLEDLGALNYIRLK